MPQAIVRPRDAAGLVLFRGTGEGREVLLGRRRRTARFLPGVYVFPGGRLEGTDSRPSGFREAWRPLPGNIDRATRRKANALLRAAFRETLEETGVMVGHRLQAPPPAPGPDAAWRLYGEAGVTPAFERACLLARAITPTVSPIRFHTRFFLLDATGLDHGRVRDDELEDVAWVPLGEIRDLPMVDVTSFVLDQALRGPQPEAGLFAYRNNALRADLKRRLAASAGWGA